MAGSSTFIPPVILRNTVCVSDNGVQFSTLEDVDVGATDVDGNLLAKYRVKSTDANGAPATYDISVTVSATSGLEKVQQFTICNTHVPFRELILSEPDVTMIRSVIDSEGDEYHEVESLSQDTVFIPVDNTDPDKFDVKSNEIDQITNDENSFQNPKVGQITNDENSFQNPKILE